MPVAGVQELQIFGRVFVFAVAQVGGQHRQGVLRGSAGYHEAGRLDVNVATGKKGGLIFSRLAAGVG